MAALTQRKLWPPPRVHVGQQGRGVGGRRCSEVARFINSLLNYSEKSRLLGQIRLCESWVSSNLLPHGSQSAGGPHLHTHKQLKNTTQASVFVLHTHTHTQRCSVFFSLHHYKHLSLKLFFVCKFLFCGLPNFYSPQRQTGYIFISHYKKLDH